MREGEADEAICFKNQIATLPSVARNDRNTTIMKKFILLFLVLCLSFSSSAHALKIFGKGSKEYDVVFKGTPISVQVMRPGESADAIEGDLQDNAPRHVAVFSIDRVLIGEFAKHKRGGASRMDQAGEAFKNKDLLNAFTLNFKNPEDMIDREKIRIAVKDAGATFGLTPGGDMVYFEHKIYLKRISEKPETFLFIKSVPIQAASREK